MLDVEFTQLTDPGRVREHNEDYLGYVLPHASAQLRSHGCLFALADGVGGQQKGEVASRVAVESVLAGFVRAREGEPHKALLTRLVQAANTEVYETGGASGSRTGMATTLVACALRFDRAVIAHVGDSRCYLIRSGQPKQITHRPHGGQRTDAAGNTLGSRSRGIGQQALAEPLGGQRHVRRRGDQRRPGAEG